VFIGPDAMWLVTIDATSNRIVASSAAPRAVTSMVRGRPSVVLVSLICTSVA
jgi:hypothetical protein